MTAIKRPAQRVGALATAALATAAFATMALATAARADAAASSGAVVGAARSPRHCTIRVDDRSGTVRINGLVVIGAKRALSAAAMRAALGAPTRTIVKQRRSRFERFRNRATGSRASSTLVTVRQTHYVYDRHGLVLVTRASRFRAPRQPTAIYVMFRAGAGATGNAGAFQHGVRAVAPRARFAGSLWINGQRVQPSARLVPRGVTYRSKAFKLLGTRFAPTSRARVIDSIYAYGGKRALRIYFDDPAHQRAAIIEIK